MTAAKLPRRRKFARIPPFHTVPSRLRCDGWTALKQAEFIGHLAETGSVREAASRVGMARETAYRLRRREGAESFVAAWDAALARGRGKAAPPVPAIVWPPVRPPVTGQERPKPKRKVTLPELLWRMDTGIWRLKLRHGRYIGVSQKADNSAVLEILRRTNRTQLFEGGGGYS